ncbi:TPA: hypothetical protein U9I93_001577 [Acinetobacter baumannii]|uniref:hypothetical protein n=1 Tax=Acinetobacter baumannii TaxID=470 RepID=UPI0009627BDB|nr:hypothetical protein [Acinetobacter baumannii]HEN9535267.1 hypothetical protein [Acinetobacter baumannii]
MQFIKSNLQFLLVPFVIILTLIILGLITYLKFEKYIESTDFVTLVTVVFMLMLICLFYGKISKISGLGASLELKKINEESEKLLKKLRIENYIARLELIGKSESTFCSGNNVQLNYKKDLFAIIKDLKNDKLLSHKVIKEKFLPVLDRQIQLQLKTIQDFGDVLDLNPFIGLSEPKDLKLAITDQVIDLNGFNGLKDNVAKVDFFNENLKIYKDLLKANSWFLNKH